MVPMKISDDHIGPIEGPHRKKQALMDIYMINSPLIAEKTRPTLVSHLDTFNGETMETTKAL